jgi:hypothetical protein
MGRVEMLLRVKELEQSFVPIFKNAYPESPNVIETFKILCEELELKFVRAEIFSGYRLDSQNRVVYGFHPCNDTELLIFLFCVIGQTTTCLNRTKAIVDMILKNLKISRYSPELYNRMFA